MFSVVSVCVRVSGSVLAVHARELLELCETKTHSVALPSTFAVDLLNL